MQKQRKAVKVRQNNNNLANKQSQGPLVPLKFIDDILSHVLWAVLWFTNPSRWEKLTVCFPQAWRPPDQLDPEGWWCWLWLPHHHHFSGHPLADHTPTTLLPHLVFKNIFSSKLLGELGSFKHSYLDCLLGTCHKCWTFLHHNLVLVDWSCCTQGEQTWS